MSAFDNSEMELRHMADICSSAHASAVLSMDNEDNPTALPGAFYVVIDEAITETDDSGGFLRCTQPPTPKYQSRTIIDMNHHRHHYWVSTWTNVVKTKMGKMAPVEPFLMPVTRSREEPRGRHEVWSRSYTISLSGCMLSFVRSDPQPS